MVVVHRAAESNADISAAWKDKPVEMNVREEKLVTLLDGEILKIVCVRALTRAMNSWMIGQERRTADVLIFLGVGGNVSIMVHPRQPTTLSNAARIIRFEEQLRTGTIVERDWNNLCAAGRIVAAPEWMLSADGKRLTAGKTDLSLKEISKYVIASLDPRAFYQKFEHECRRGICASMLIDPCPWYDWGLPRCRQLRAAMKARQSALIS